MANPNSIFFISFTPSYQTKVPATLIAHGVSKGRCTLVTESGFLHAMASQKAEHNRNEEKSRNRCQDQSTDHSAAQRRILLAAFAQSARHRRHADNHRR